MNPSNRFICFCEILKIFLAKTLLEERSRKGSKFEDFRTEKNKILSRNAIHFIHDTFSSITELV